MTFIIKKKKFKFQVEFQLEELTEVPYVNAVLFAKVRLLDGGSFSEISSREDVINHTVKWGAYFSFTCKMSASASTGILDPCICRVSVRKELRGGRTFQKLGRVDLNLAEFAGSGLTSHRCILQGYDTHQRQDNSMLKVAIHMTLRSGDPCFKAPTSLHVAIPGETEEGFQERGGEEYSGGSVASGSSGFNSLTRKRPGVKELVEAVGAESIAVEGGDPVEPLESHEPGHSRNSSNTSHMSQGYGSVSSQSQSQHSRQSSSGESGHTRNLSSGSGFSETGSTEKQKACRKKFEEEGMLKEAGVSNTRVDPVTVIDEIIGNLESSKIGQDDAVETSGLRLYIARDGTTALGSEELKNRMTAGVFEPVVVSQLPVTEDS